MLVSYTNEILVVHRLSRRQPLGVIVAEQIVEKVDRISLGKMLILLRTEAFPVFFRASAIIKS